MIKLSIIIVSYNTKEILNRCLQSLTNNLSRIKEFKTEVIIVDNNSTDGTKSMLQNFQGKATKIIFNKENVGYGKANNQGVQIASGDYILFLNSDVIVGKINFSKIIDYINRNLQVGVVTVKVKLSNGKIDPACHRGFPTLWRSFCYYVGLEKLFGFWPILGQVFGGYHLSFLNKKIIHEIDSPTGAFYLIRKEIFNKIGGFDETFFFYGEDLDLSFQVKKLGYQVIFYPDEEVLHLKYQSGLKGKDLNHRKKIKKYFNHAMKLFYQKNYANSNPKLINSLVYFLIDLKTKFS